MSDIFGKISINPQKPETPKKGQRKSRPPKSNRRQATGSKIWENSLIWSIIPIGLITLYSIVGFWGVPYYLTTSIPKQAAKEYDVVISTGKVSFNPFTFTLRSESTEVGDHQGKPIVKIPHLELKFAPIQLLRMDFVCTKVIITSPSLSIVRNDNGSYNFSNLLPSLKESNSSTGMIGFSDLPFSFSLNNISIIDGTLAFDDKPNKKTHNISEIELQFPTFSNIDFQADNYITPHFSAVVNGGPVSFKDKSNDSSNSDPLNQLTWEMKDFPLQDYVTYIPFELPFSITKGTVEGIVGLNFDNLDKKEEKLSINFKLTIENIDFETHQKKLQLRSPAMHITGSFTPVKKLFFVEDLQFESPEFTAHTPHLLQELSSVFLLQKKEAQLGLIEKPVKFSLQSFQFTNGRLSHKKTPNKTESPVEWTNLELNIGNYISNESDNPTNNKPSSVSLQGQSIDKTTSFSYMGSFESPSTLSGKLSVSNITSQSLFSFILPDETATTFKGSAKFDSVFSLTKTNDSKHFTSSLSQTNVTIENVEIFDKDKPILTAKELTFSNALLTSDSVNLGSIKIQNGDLSYTKGNSSIFSKIVSEQYSISNFDYTGKVNIHTKNIKASPFTLKNASIKYSDNNDAQQKINNIAISGFIGTGGKVEATGTASLNPFKLALSTTFNHIDNSTLTAIVPENNFVSKATGKISGKGKITFPQTAFTGDLSLVNGSYNTNKDQTLSWSECNVENINFTTQPYHLGVGSISLHKPKLIIPITPHKGSMDQQLSDFLRNTLQRDITDTPKQLKISISPVDIQKITISSGGLTLEDHRLSPVWIGEALNVNGTIENIHSARLASNSPFTFTGTLGGSDFTWKGAINPLKNTQTDKHQFAITNYPLNNFAQQLKPLSDMNFDSATLSLTYSSDWVNGDLSHSVRSNLAKLKIDHVNSESALPLAIIADVNGNAKMDFSAIQVNPQKDSNLFDDLTRNWQKRMLKGSISPLLITTGDFTDLMDHDFINFKPGQFMLSDTGRKTLLRYGALLVAHPNIKLRLSGGISLIEDSKSLHKQLEKNEKQRVENKNEKLFAKWQQKKKEYESQFKNDQKQAISTGQIAESNIPNKVLAGFRPLLPEPVVVDNEMLFDLAEKRLDIVKQHFMAKLSLAKGRVEITQQLTDTLSVEKEGEGVHVEIMPFASSLLFSHD